MILRALIALLPLVTVTLATALADTFGSGYRSNGRCGPYARAPIKTPDWACVGIVAGPTHGLVMPRAIVEIAARRFIITDMGSWSPGKGRVLQLDVSSEGAGQMTVLYDRLDLAHGLAIGPDGKVYVGERGAIWRFDPAKQRAPREVLVDGLPTAGLHRLKHIIFDRNGDLIINIGAPTDRCEGGGQLVIWPCPSENSQRPLGALWRLRLSDSPVPKPRLESLALGLRNSVAMAVHPVSGLILQGENSADYPGEDFPPDELNVIQPGKHYGWPYCVGNGTVIPEYQRHVVDCSRYTSPIALLPAHSAPLGMLYYFGGMFPELSGNLIISLHGYRSNGHRIIAVPIDETGRPSAVTSVGGLAGTELVGGWNAQPGIRPLGAPVGVSQARDGSLWFVEDKNRTVMVVLRSDRYDKVTELPGTNQGHPEADRAPAPEGWTNLYGQVIRSRCGQCHAELRGDDPARAWEESVGRGWIQINNLATSKLFQSMYGSGGVRQMPPPPSVLDRNARWQLNTFLRSIEKPASKKK